MDKATITISNLINEVTHMAYIMLKKNSGFKKTEMKKSAKHTINKKFGTLKYKLNDTIEINLEIFQILILDCLEDFLEKNTFK